MPDYKDLTVVAKKVRKTGKNKKKRIPKMGSLFFVV